MIIHKVAAGSDRNVGGEYLVERVSGEEVIELDIYRLLKVWVKF